MSSEELYIRATAEIERLRADNATLRRTLDEATERIATLRKEWDAALIQLDHERYRYQDERGLWLDTRDSNKRLVAQLAEALGLLDKCLSVIRHPDNGDLHCRWCTAGASNNWLHQPQCVYADRVNKIEAVRAEVRAFLSRPDAKPTPLSGVESKRSKVQHDPNCAIYATDVVQACNCGATAPPTGPSAEAVIEGLEKHARHNPACGIHGPKYGEPCICTCGLDAALQLAAEWRKGGDCETS